MIARLWHWLRAVWAWDRQAEPSRPPVRFYRGGQTGLEVVRRGLDRSRHL